MMCKANCVPTVKEIMPRQAMPHTCSERRFAISCASEAQKDLDSTLNMYIIIVTFQGRHSGDLVNAQQGGQEIQARCPQAARHAQSASERGNRSPVRNWRFLRPRRHRASQVRDASPRHSRQAVGHSVRYSIRLLTPYLLSSGNRFSAKWPVRALAREARTPARSQTHLGGSGLRYATPRERSFAAPSGLGCCHPGTVRNKCSSTEYRTRTETAGKKTSLNPTTGARKTAEPETLTSAYEALRRQAAECRVLEAWAWPFFLTRGWWHGCWHAPGLPPPIPTTCNGTPPLSHLYRMSFAGKSSWYWQQWPSTRHRRFIHEHRNQPEGDCEPTQTQRLSLHPSVYRSPSAGAYRKYGPSIRTKETRRRSRLEG